MKSISPFLEPITAKTGAIHLCENKDKFMIILETFCEEDKDKPGLVYKVLSI